MSAEGWANIVAVIALLGSALGFWLNRRQIRSLRDAAAEVRWGLSHAGVGDMAQDLSVECENAVKLTFDEGCTSAGRSACVVTAVSAWGLGPRVLKVSWSTKPEGPRKVWHHPFSPTASAGQGSQ